MIVGKAESLSSALTIDTPIFATPYQPHYRGYNSSLWRASGHHSADRTVIQFCCFSSFFFTVSL